MIAENSFLACRIEYRHNPAISEAGFLHLGVVVEFESDGMWVIGVRVRKVLSPEQQTQLDPIAKDLLSGNLPKFVSRMVMESISTGDVANPGAVLHLLAANNPWSIHVTPPETYRKPEEDQIADLALAVYLNHDYEYMVFSRPVEEVQVEELPSPWNIEDQVIEMPIISASVEPNTMTAA